jgi:hypothetical protein
VPVRTFADWKDPVVGYAEVDLVAHCGDSVAGSFSYTLVLTDIASGWTECAALLVREGTLIVDAGPPPPSWGLIPASRYSARFRSHRDRYPRSSSSPRCSQ